MIRMCKDYGKRPDHLETANCRNKAGLALTEKNRHNFSKHYYGNTTHVLPDLERIYHEKCAYCESEAKHVATLQVEHYRPCRAVREDNEHEGYYWLAYEWSNLLLACPKCNGRSGKGDKFPIEGKRVYLPPTDSHGNLDRTRCNPKLPPLHDEKPLLLNPETDDPELHFRFDRHCKIIGITDRGKATIEICGLNRELLNRERRKVVDRFVREISLILLGFTGGSGMPEASFKAILRKIFEEMEERRKSYHTYALLGRFIFDEFEFFVVSRVEPYFQEAIRKAFNAYKSGKL